MKNYKYKIIISFFVALLCFTSCEQDKVMMYEQNGGVTFKPQSDVNFSFFDNPGTMKAICEVPVVISGFAMDYDRTISVELIEGDTTKVTTARSEHYKILGGVVPAGEFVGKVSVEINYQKDMDAEIFNLFFKIVANEDFPMVQSSPSISKMTMTNQIIQPSNWGSFYWYFGSPFSTNWYEFILDVIGMRYLPFGNAVIRPGDHVWSYDEMLANVGNVKSALLKYNKENPDEPLRHKDGKFEGELVEMP